MNRLIDKDSIEELNNLERVVMREGNTSIVDSFIILHEDTLEGYVYFNSGFDNWVDNSVKELCSNSVDDPNSIREAVIIYESSVDIDNNPLKDIIELVQIYTIGGSHHVTSAPLNYITGVIVKHEVLDNVEYVDDKLRFKEQSKPECDCCSGTYKILIQTRSATVNQPTQYQYLNINGSDYETDILKDSISKYVEQLENYKRAQLSLMNIPDIAVDINLKEPTADKPNRCPHCGEIIE